MKRIYFHYLEKNLESQDELKNHLFIYLQGFEELNSAYSPYPDALLYMNYIISIGQIITRIEPKQPKNTEEYDDNENFLISKQRKNKDFNLESTLSRDTNQQKLNIDFYLNESTIINNLSPFLLCAINLYYNLKKKSPSQILDLYLNNLFKASININEQNW